MAKKHKGKRKDDRHGGRAPDAADWAAPELLRPLVVARPVDPPTAASAPEPTARLDVAAPGAQGLQPLARLGGAQLCYGEAVTAGDRTVIPVARVRVAGGWGSGDTTDSRGGGGGLVGADAVGYIEVDGGGSRYVAIPSARPGARALLGAALAGAAGVAVALTSARPAGRRRRGFWR